MSRSAWMVVAGLTLCVAHTTSAQDSRQRAAAAEAYDRGTTDYMTGNYAEAARWFETAHRMAPQPAALMQAIARWFETAHRMAPQPAALMQAIRAHQKAENPARAATLALTLQTDYPGEAQAVQYAEQILAETAPTLFRVDVECSACEIDLDEAVQQGRAFYVEPDTHHSIVVHFSTGDVTRDVSGSAGETTTIEVSAPAARIDVTEDPTGTANEPSRTASEGLPPIVTFVGAGVTGVLLIATVASAIDMYAGVDEYEKAAKAGAPNAQQLLDEARGQTRTNVLIGITAVSAVATGVIALALTDWSSDEDADTHAAVVPTADGVMGFVESRF